MQNIGLKFKTVGRGLAERFVFMPRPRNVFSLFAKIPSFSSPSPYFSSISSIYVYPRFLTSDSILGSALTQSFLVFYTRSEFYLSEERELDKLFDRPIRLGSLSFFRPDTKFSIRSFSLRPNVGRNVNDLFEFFFFPFLLCPSSQWSTHGNGNRETRSTGCVLP